MRSRAGSLKSHFTVNAAVTAALVLAISAVGIWSIVKLSSALERTTIASMAIRNHMGADMMHDALRADVLAAVLAGQSGSDADKQGVKADLKEHVAAFENFIGENAALTLSTTIKAALDNVKTPLAAYIAKASDMVDLATSNPAAAAPRMPEFMDAFSNLETAMETTSQAIEADIESNTASDAAMARAAIISMVAALVAGLAFVVLAGFLLRRAIVPPVLALTTVMGRLAEGDASLEVPGTERQNEIGRMARSVEVFKQNAKENERLRLEQETLKTKTEADRRTQRQQLADDFERKVGSMVRAVSLAAEEVRGAAESMSETADRTNSQAKSVAASSEETAASVQTVAAATEELAASIMEIGRQVERSATIAEQAVGEAERSDQIIAGLAEGANRIGEIVGLITDIAEQTNLLALNATIEAARAGDAGRGFAVVASEVKGLAGQTAKATDEISGKVREVGNSVQLVIDAVRAIGGTIREINQTATAISTAVDQQQSATQEISSSVGHAARGTKDVSASIVGVRRDASSAGSAAGKILGVAERLSQHAAQLSTEVDGFIAEMKAA